MTIRDVHQLSSRLALERTHAAHYPSREVAQAAASGTAPRTESSAEARSLSLQPEAPGAPLPFAEALRNGLQSVNEADKNHRAIAELSVIAPDQVDVHDVTIAAAKADLSIRLARNIIDRTLSAYREITSLR